MKLPKFIYPTFSDTTQVSSLSGIKGVKEYKYISVDSLKELLYQIIEEESVHGQLRESIGIRRTARRLIQFISEK